MLDRLPVEPRQADRTAERRRGEAHRAVGDQGRAFASVNRVPLHVDEQIKVAAGRAPHSGLAFSGHADSGAFVDTSRNFHRQFALRRPRGPRRGTWRTDR